MRARNTRRADSVNEMVIRQLIREYMIRYDPIKTSDGTGSSGEKGPISAVLKFIKEAVVATGVIFLLNNKDTLTTFASKAWGLIKSAPETVSKIKDFVASLSGSVTGPGGIASAVANLVPESSRITTFNQQKLFEADAAVPQAASGPIYDTVYGGLLSTIKVAEAARQNFSRLQATRQPILSFDRIVVDANMDTDAFKRNLESAKTKILSTIKQINEICDANANYPENFSSMPWIRSLAVPVTDLKIPGNDPEQTKIAKQVLSDSLAIAVYNSLKDDVIDIIKYYYDSINKIDNDEARNQFLGILKNFVKDVIGDIFETQISNSAKKILLP